MVPPTPPPAAACSCAAQNTDTGRGGHHHRSGDDRRRWPPASRPGPVSAATSAPRTSSGFQSRWQTVRGIDIHDRASLSGANVTPPLVLVHGLAVSHRYLMPLAARRAGHHPVQVVDLPGFGLSSDPGRVLDVAQHADHLAAWLEAAGLPPVTVLGNSFGCQVPGSHNANHGAADHLAELVLAFLRQRVVTQGGQAS